MATAVKEAQPAEAETSVETLAVAPMEAAMLMAVDTSEALREKAPSATQVADVEEHPSKEGWCSSGTP